MEEKLGGGKRGVSKKVASPSIHLLSRQLAPQFCGRARSWWRPISALAPLSHCAPICFAQSAHFARLGRPIDNGARNDTTAPTRARLFS